ncbi:hypothetical protein EVAR_27414_1 [Eumeta japonica]|uniref:Reverse transcriptase domain-containing protein n=1 Tax=Eumeta variegata TaxID=151549 RepID=A0A4C1X2K3_EUMVA|nr:hypothetical protein EVAR_27414_1 [Eumeta japonica]
MVGIKRAIKIRTKSMFGIRIRNGAEDEANTPASSLAMVNARPIRLKGSVFDGPTTTLHFTLIQSICGQRYNARVLLVNQRTVVETSFGGPEPLGTGAYPQILHSDQRRLAQSNLMSIKQFVITRGRSTIDADLPWEDSRNVVGVFCNLSKVFDHVNHEILIGKPPHHKVTGLAVGFLKSYLRNRIHRLAGGRIGGTLLTRSRIKTENAGRYESIQKYVSGSVNTIKTTRQTIAARSTWTPEAQRRGNPDEPPN